MDFQSILTKILLFAPVFIISLSVHEWAHAWSAYKLGDSTAKYLGRMTLDPMSHISWFGTVVFPLISISLGGIFFGWANPVPVDPRNFTKPRQHMAIVALAGPVSNVILAVLCTVLLFLVSSLHPLQQIGLGQIEPPLIMMINLAILVNLTLAVFNMLPLPPLDGAKVLQGIVKPAVADRIDSWGPYAQMILIGLLFTGILGTLLVPAAYAYTFLIRSIGAPSVFGY